MKFQIQAKEFCKAIEAATTKSKLKQDCCIEAVQETVIIRASDGASYHELMVPATVEREGKTVVYAPMLLKLLKAVNRENLSVELRDGSNRLVVRLDDGAEYLLPLGFKQDDFTLGQRLSELMSQATAVASIKPRVWIEAASAVKRFVGDFEFSHILLLPISQPNWTLTSRVAAVAATDQVILGAVLLDPEQVELYTDSIVFIPPEMSMLAVESFALATYEDKTYIYAVLQNGFVGSVTHKNERSSLPKIIDRLLTAPADVELKFDRTTWVNFKKAVTTYREQKKSVGRSMHGTSIRWDIHPDGSHRLWSTTENAVLFTADKPEIFGTIPRTCTFWVNLIAKAIEFIPTPSAIELSFNEHSCTMRLRDEFNYRVCVLQSMVVGSDYESFNSTGGGEDEEN